MKPSNINIIKSLLSGPGLFILSYSMLVLSPLILIKFLDITPKSGTFDIALNCGIVAFMILLSTCFFSGRFEWMNGHRGMDLMIKFHRRIAFFALSLIILHIFLVLPYSIPNNFGQALVAFIILLAIIGITKSKKRTKIKYETWRFIHGVMAIIILISICTHAINEGSYSEHPVMQGLWITLTSLAVLSLPYIHIYLSSKAKHNLYTIEQITQVGRQQWTVDLIPKHKNKFKYFAGQYAFVAFQNEGNKRLTFNPFSFASSPSQSPKVTFTIKETGDFTSQVKDLKVGTNVYIDGPYGYMSREAYRGPKNKESGIVLVAAGVGITPMLSILREMNATCDETPVRLFYSCRYLEDVVYLNELKELENKLNFKLNVVISSPPSKWKGETGRIDKDYIESKLMTREYNEHIYFICGTTSFVSDTVDNISSIPGVPLYNIRYEDFSVYD